MNEGHSAFLSLERIRELVQGGMEFDEAAEIVRAGNIFTTHTPVAAGHDAFPLELVDKFFWQYWGQMGIDRERFLGLARHEHAVGSGVQHDRPGISLERVSQWRERAARKGFQADVGATVAGNT